MFTQHISNGNNIIHSSSSASMQNESQSLCELYQETYLKEGHRKIAQIVANIAPEATTTKDSTGSKITIAHVSNELQNKIIEKISKEKIFGVHVGSNSSQVSTHIQMQMAPTISKRSWLGANNAVALALSHPNPFQFLADHFDYWRGSLSEPVYAFLSSEEYISNPQVINLLSQCLLKENVNNLDTQMILPTFLKALTYQPTRNQALDVLKKVVQNCINRQEFGRDYETLEDITKHLRCFSQDPDIRDILHMILNTSNTTSTRRIAHVSLGNTVPYSDFYSTMFFKNVQEICSRITMENAFPVGVTRDNEDILVTVSTDAQLMVIEKKLYCLRSGFLHGRVSEETSERADKTLRIKIIVKDDGHFIGNIVEMAAQFTDPIRFLLDHRLYWSDKSKDVIAYLAKPENIEQEGVIDILETFCGRNDDEVLETKQLAIKTLGALLEKPLFKERAKSLLLYAAKFDAHKYPSQNFLRIEACKILKPLLNETDVHETLTNIAETCPLIPLRGAVRSIIDGIDQVDYYLHTLVVKQVIQSFDFSRLFCNNKMELEYFLWSNLPFSAQAMKELDEAHISSIFCHNLSTASPKDYPHVQITAFRGVTPLGGFSSHISDTVPDYSILKFIALHTKNIEVFNNIVQTLVDATHGKEMGLMEPLDVVLAQLKDNASFDLPDSINKLAKPNLAVHEKRAESALTPSPNRESERNLWTRCQAETILELIQSDDTDITLRILALRYSLKYLFAEQDYPARQKDNDDYNNKLWPVVQELSVREDISILLKEEAKLILNWHQQKSHNS